MSAVLPDAKRESGLFYNLHRRVYKRVIFLTAYYGLELLPLANSPTRKLMRRKQPSTILANAFSSLFNGPV